MQGQRTVAASRPGKAPVEGGSRRIPGRLLSSLLVMLRRYPARVVGAAGCLAMGGTIVGNAVLFQSGRHPAPLFGHAVRASQPAAALPMPVPRPALPSAPDVRQIGLTPPDRKQLAEVSTVASAAPVVTNATRVPVAKPASARRADAIAKLLRGADNTPVGTADADPRIVAAQRSLAQLGFAVKQDGRLGGSTRRALETFGHDHHWVVGAEISQRMLHELAAAAAARSSR